MTDIGKVIQKRKLGQTLTESDKKIARQDAKERRTRMIPLYFSTREEKERFLSLAEKDGVRVFSKWALVKLREISKGDLHTKEFVDQIKKERDQLQKWYEVEKEKVARLEREKDDLNRKLQALAEKLAALALKVKP